MKVIKEYHDKTPLDLVKEQIGRGVTKMGEDFASRAALGGGFVSTQAALNTTVQWAQGLEDQGNLLDNFAKLDGEKKIALGGGSFVAIKTAANAFGAIKDCAGEVIEKTNQQLGAGTLTKSFSGTTLFELGGEKK